MEFLDDRDLAVAHSRVVPDRQPPYPAVRPDRRANRAVADIGEKLRDGRVGDATVRHPIVGRRGSLHDGGSVEEGGDLGPAVLEDGRDERGRVVVPGQSIDEPPTGRRGPVVEPHLAGRRRVRRVRHEAGGRRSLVGPTSERQPAEDGPVLAVRQQRCLARLDAEGHDASARDRQRVGVSGDERRPVDGTVLDSQARRNGVPTALLRRRHRRRRDRRRVGPAGRGTAASRQNQQAGDEEEAAAAHGLPPGPRGGNASAPVLHERAHEKRFIRPKVAST